MGFEKSGLRTVNITITSESIEKLKTNWKEFVDGIDHSLYSAETPRGIVICAGGISYMTCALINIEIIRRTGCDLPIELWYTNNEVSDDIVSHLTEINVMCKCIDDFSEVKANGYALKPLSIILSSFKEVLFLDADNMCNKDPTYLFDDKNFKRTGTTFWKDFWKTTEDNPIWQITGNKFVDEFEQESGQMLINREMVWKGLNLCLYFNLNPKVYHTLLHGDKDTFRFAWKALKMDYHIIETPPSIAGYIDKDGNFRGNSMVQYDIEHEIIFFHRNLLKWDVTLNGEKTMEYIKKFKTIDQESSYEFSYNPAAKSLYLDIHGDTQYEKLDSDVETIALETLHQLRSKNYYLNYLLYCYLRDKRFGNSKFNLTS